MSKSTMAQPLAASTSPRLTLAGMRYNIRPCPIVPVRMVSSLLRPRFTRCPFSCSSSSSSSNSISARSSKPLASRHGALNIVRLSSSSSRAVSLGSVSKKRDAYLFEVMWEDNDKPQTFQTEQSMMARYNHLLKESRLMATLSARKRFERPRDKLQRERMERIEYIKWQRKQGAYLPESLESAGGQEQRLEEPFFDVFGLATDGDEYQDTAAAAATAANAQFVEQRLNYGHYANNPANILDLSQFMNDFDSSSSSSSESNIWGGYMDQQVPAGAGVSGVNPPGDYGGYVNPGGYVNQGSLLYPVMAHPDTAAAAAAGVSSSGGLLNMEQFAAAGAAGGGQQQQQQQPYMDSDPSITGFMTYQQQQQQTSNDLAHPEMGAGVVAGGTDWAAWTNQTLSTAAAGPQAAAAASEDSAFTMPPLPPVLPLWQQYDVNQPLLGTSGDVDAQQEQLDKLYQQYEQLLLQQQQQHLQQLQQQPEFAAMQQQWQQWQQPEAGQQVMASPLAAAAAGGDSDLAPDSQAVISEPMLPEYEPAAEPSAAVQDLQQLLSSAAEPSAAVQDLQQPLSTAAAAVSTGVADVTPAALPSVEVQEPPQVSAAAAVNAADIEPRSDVAGSRQPSRRQLGSNKPRQQRRQPQQQSAQPRGKQQQQQPAFSAAATAASLQQAQAALAASMEKLQALDALLAARGLAPQQQQQQQQVANDVSASSSSSSVVPQGDRQAYDTGSGSNDRVRQSSGRSRPSNGKRSMQRIGSTAAAAVKTKAVDPEPRDLSAVS